MAAVTLVKNATLWQWSDGSPRGMKTGRAVPKSWFCVEKGAITVSSTDSSGALEIEPPADANFDSVVDAKHRLVIPGLHDAHIHVAMTGESNYFLNLKYCDSIEKMVDSLSTHASKFPVSVLPWINGVNWDQTELGRYPTREDLDIACPDRPVFLWRACWHIGVVNTVGLRLAKLMKPIEGSALELTEEVTLNESPPGGVIDKDEQGVPTGILRERAVELIVAIMGKKSHLDISRFITEGLRLCSSMGLTSVQSNDASSLAVYKVLREECSLPLRVFLTPNYEEIATEVSCNSVDRQNIAYENQAEVRPYRPQCMPRSTATSQALALDSNLSVAPVDQNKMDFSTPESRLIVERLKIYADGSLGAETAAMKIPEVPKADLLVVENVDAAAADAASDSVSASAASRPDAAEDATTSPRHTGILSHSSGELVRMISHARSNGLRVEVHAIGDAAAEQVLDAFDVAGVLPSERPVLTHCQVLSSSLIDRMASGGVVANVQPSFVPTDMRWVQQRLTPVQQRYSYAWKTLLERGVCVAGGSDAPIESCSPLLGMFDAIYRQARSTCKDGEEEEVMNDSTTRDSTGRERDIDRLTTTHPEVFRAEEALSFAEALWIYTVGAAYAAGCETFLGSLTVGYAADFVIIDADVLNDHRLLATMKPHTVVVGGIISYSREDPVPSNETTLLCSEITMAGPYIPGKNGRRPDVKKYKSRQVREAQIRLSEEPMPLNCACRLLGQYCSATYKWSV